MGHKQQGNLRFFSFAFVSHITKINLLQALSLLIAVGLGSDVERVGDHVWIILGSPLQPSGSPISLPMK